jgi:phosphopantetheine adenylyltransferase
MLIDVAFAAGSYVGIATHDEKVVWHGLELVHKHHLRHDEYEFQMALTNRKLASDIETIFLMPHESYSYLSSRLLKEAAVLGADLSNFVPNFVEQALKNSYARLN